MPAEQTHHDRHTDADATQGGATATFDITKQVWTFDPDDMTITVDGMWVLCQLHGEDDFPCVEEPEERNRLQAEAEACGNAVAALPQLLAALCRARLDLKIVIDQTPFGSSAEQTADEAVARIDAALALATRREPSDAGRVQDGETV